jgi:hypothetical protein
MRLDHIVMAAVQHLLGRLLRRALLALAIAALAMVAIFHFDNAGTIALEAQYSALHAQAIVGGIYTGFALIAFVILWAMRGNTSTAAAPALSDRLRMCCGAA